MRAMWIVRDGGLELMSAWPKCNPVKAHAAASAKRAPSGRFARPLACQLFVHCQQTQGESLMNVRHAYPGDPVETVSFLFGHEFVEKWLLPHCTVEEVSRV